MCFQFATVYFSRLGPSSWRLRVLLRCDSQLGSQQTYMIPIQSILLGHASDCNLTDVEQSGKVLKQVGIMCSLPLPTSVTHTSRATLHKLGTFVSGGLYVLRLYGNRYY